MYTNDGNPRILQVQQETLTGTKGKKKPRLNTIKEQLPPLHTGVKNSSPVTIGCAIILCVCMCVWR